MKPVTAKRLLIFTLAAQIGGSQEADTFFF
jgi:hypothetical protein